MDFSEYNDFNDLVQSKYAWAYTSYPYAMMVLDKSIRQWEAGRENRAIRNLDKFAKHDIKWRICEKWMRIISEINYRKNPKLVVSLSRFPELANIVVTNSYKKEIAPLKTPIGYKSIPNLILLRNVALFQCAMTAKKASGILRKLYQDGLNDLLNKKM